MRKKKKIHDREIFTPTENQIISFIMDHTSQVIGMSLEDLSDQLYVSKSTIIRFCKKLGFAGHKEFCVQLARELNSFMASESELDPSFPFERDDSNSALAEKILALKFNSLNDTFAELDQDAIHTLAKAIHEHRSVTVYTSDENRFAAFELESRLENIGYNVNVIYIQNSMLKRAMSQKPESAVLFISYGQRVPAMPQAARILSEKKIPVFLITGPTRGLLEKYAETIIRIGYYEPSPKVAAFGSSAGLSLILDLLYGYLFEMDHDHNINLVKSESEWQKTENIEPER